MSDLYKDRTVLVRQTLRDVMTADRSVSSWEEIFALQGPSRTLWVRWPGRWNACLWSVAPDPHNERWCSPPRLLSLCEVEALAPAPEHRSKVLPFRFKLWPRGGGSDLFLKYDQSYFSLIPRMNVDLATPFDLAGAHDQTIH